MTDNYPNIPFSKLPNNHNLSNCVFNKCECKYCKSNCCIVKDIVKDNSHDLFAPNLKEQEKN